MKYMLSILAVLSFSSMAEECNQYDLQSDAFRNCIRGNVIKKVKAREKKKIIHNVNTKSAEELTQMGFDDARKGLKQARELTREAASLSVEGVKFGGEQFKNGMGLVQEALKETGNMKNYKK